MADIDAMLAGARDAMTAGRVFGEPVERDGVTVIPAAAVRGCGCRCGGADSGDRGGFGIKARPAGSFVIRDGEVTWKPALDLGRLLTGVAVLTAIALLCRRRRR